MEFQKVVVVGETNLVDSIVNKIQKNGESQQIVKGSIEEILTLDVRNCDLIIDTYDESIQHYKERLARIEQYVSERTVLAGFHTGESVTKIAYSLKRPKRFIGLHFFQVGKLTNLVEVVLPEGIIESENLANNICLWLEKSGFVPVMVKDRPGLLAFRLMIPYLNQAAQAFDDGIATSVDIDNSVMLGLGYPVGALKRLDQIGIDRFVSKAQDIFNELPEKKYAVPPILYRMIESGRLGEKSGEGFYSYEK